MDLDVYKRQARVAAVMADSADAISAGLIWAISLGIFSAISLAAEEVPEAPDIMVPCAAPM